MPAKDTTSRVNRASVEERFFAKVEFTDTPCTARPELGPCWLWTAAINSCGYGSFWDGDRIGQAHRWVYEFCVGEIPDGLTIDHLCRVRNCVNPWHMEPVTNKENILRGEAPSASHALKTHCPKGHAYDSNNTYVARNGSRHCRRCESERVRILNDHQRALAAARQLKYRARLAEKQAASDAC